MSYLIHGLVMDSASTRRDHILQNSTGLYYQNSVQWLEKFRTVAEVRSDFYWFDVRSNNGANSGSQYDSITPGPRKHATTANARASR
jgi:hypothetical protein